MREQGLIVANGGSDKVTAGALLLFGKRTQDFFPHAVVSLTEPGKKRQIYEGGQPHRPAPPQGYGRRGRFAACQARERPDLILCDVQMPKLDGFEVARQVRRDPQLSNMSLVAVTASVMQGDLEKVMSAGFNGYITKPIVPEEFVIRAEEFLRVDLRSGATQRTSPAIRGEMKRSTCAAAIVSHEILSQMRSTLIAAVFAAALGGVERGCGYGL
jgi:CheY-like chemotaxis protein